MTSFAEQLFEADVRVERMFWLPSIAGPEEPPDEFVSEFCENLPENPAHQLYDELPQLKQFAAEGASGADVAEALRFVGGGFLVQGASPVRRYDRDGASWSSGWGHYRTCWLYAADEAGIVKRLVEWAAENNAADRVKAMNARERADV